MDTEKIFFKPKNSNFMRGAKVPTMDPRQQHLYFVEPLLSSRGDCLRQALEELEALEDFKKEEPDQEQENRKKESEIELEARKHEQKELDLKKNEVLIKIGVESIKQQYVMTAKADPEKSELAAMTDSELDEVARLVFCRYFTEGDLQIIILALRTGKVMTRGELFEFGSKRIDANPELAKNLS